jgi:fermentation-respiration switch protein FrsA (DUF1100 family)
MRRFLLRTWPLFVSLVIIFGLPFVLWTNDKGRVAVEASLYLPDMIVQPPSPFRPIELISDAPKRERITIDYASRHGARTIEADLYLPRKSGKLPAVVFSMGAPPLDLDEPRLVRIAEDSARKGVVMLVPFSDRLDEERIEPEEIDALVAQFRYVQSLPQVDPQRVGFFGASVGGSLALVAAADPRIAEDVDHVVSFGGYYDALTAFGAIATHRIEYDDVDEEWTPRQHAERVMAEQLINRIDDPRDRDLLTRLFVDRETVVDEELASLGPVGRSSYDFLANTDPAAVEQLVRNLPESAVSELNYLSPRTSIHRVRAELFIIHDRADPFIPYTESRMLEDALARLEDRGDENPPAHFDEIRLFEHVEPRLNQRPDVIALDTTRMLFRMYQLLLRWD